MQIDWFTFVAQIVNFLILILLLQRFLYKPVVQAMEEREKKIAGELEEARQKKVEAERKERDLENRLSEFDSRRKEMMDEVRQQVREERKKLLEEMRSEVSEIRKRWNEAIVDEKEAFLNELREQAAHRIIDLIEKVLSDLSERNLQQQTTARFIEMLENMDSSRLEQLRRNIRQQQPEHVEVRSSYELDDRQRGRLEALLQKLIDSDIPCRFESGDHFAFGIEVRAGGWELAWNLDAYLEQLSTQMRRFFDRQADVPEKLQLNE